jgi:ABC-2 type transport system permease protein
VHNFRFASRRDFLVALYAYVLKLQLLQSLAYRFEFISSIGSNLFFLFGSVYLWKTAYRGIDTVGGVDEGQMITYAIVSVLMSSVFQISVDENILAKVRQGDIALDFLRPIRLPLFWLVEDFGKSLTAITKFCLPVLVVAILLVKVPVPATIPAGLIFIPSCLLSYLMLWQMSALIGFSAFWVIEFGSVGNIKNIIIRILSGQLIPLWLFPDVIQRLSKYLPFQYTYQTPLEIYIGNISVTDARPILLIQALWNFLFAAILSLVWYKARHRVIVQGG